MISSLLDSKLIIVVTKNFIFDSVMVLIMHNFNFISKVELFFHQ